MNNLLIKQEGTAARCEVCHQEDYFDQEQNYCARCQTGEAAAILTKTQNETINNKPINQPVKNTKLANYFIHSPRLFVCAWFNLAAIIPIIIFFLINPFGFHYHSDFTDLLLIIDYVVLPILITLFFTFRNTSQIIVALNRPTSGLMMRKGASIAIKSLFVFTNLLMVINALFRPDTINFDFLFLWGYFVLCAFILMGWAVALAGLLSGWLLYSNVHLPNKTAI